MIHSYHRKRVSEEDRLPFGKTVGNGMLIIAATMIIFGVLSVVAKTCGEIYMTVGGIIMTFGIVIGIVLSLYAMVKYNKGIF